MEKKPVISIDISLGTYASFISGLTQRALSGAGGYVCVANVHMLIEAHQDPAFAAVVNNAAVTTPDGKPLTWALRLLYGLQQDRVAGMDLLPDLLHEAAARNIKVGFYGGAPEMLEIAATKIRVRYPGISIVYSYSPPFRALTADETMGITRDITSSGVQLLFVALGCPKQEKWMAANTAQVPALLIGIGGALPVLAGVQARAPRWMQKAGLEWLYRLLQEPKRLFRRYAVTNSLFLVLLAKAFFTSRGKR